MAQKNIVEEKMSKDEQIGFHKGSLTTLAKEQQELGRLLSIVNQLIPMHVKALQDLGVDVAKQAKLEDKTGK